LIRVVFLLVFFIVIRFIVVTVVIVLIIVLVIIPTSIPWRPAFASTTVRRLIRRVSTGSGTFVSGLGRNLFDDTGVNNVRHLLDETGVRRLISDTSIEIVLIVRRYKSLTCESFDFVDLGHALLNRRRISMSWFYVVTVKRRRPEGRWGRPSPGAQVTRVRRIEPLLRLPLPSDFIKPSELVRVIPGSFVFLT